jgi:hemerythrin-like domain-containing protein
MTAGLIVFGRREPRSDLSAALLECHERIRAFLALGARLAAAREPTATEIVQIATQVVRYFVIAFPLHVADENDTIAPRLARRSRALDDALLAMERDHDRHGTAISSFVHLCSTLSHEPARHAELASELLAATARLTALVEPHLELEESVIFPALALLSPRETEEIRAEMRARRSGLTEAFAPSVR